MRISKRIAKIACALVVAVLLNELAIFCLEPFASRVASKWADFHEMEQVDTVIVGDSLYEVGINPLVLDEKYGSTSINLGTSQQEIEESYLGLRTVLEERDVKLVVLGLDLSYMQSDTIAHPGKPFIREKNKHESVLTSLADITYLLPNPELFTTPDSVNWLFPYVTNHVTISPGKIWRNIQYKLQTEESVQTVSARYTDMGEWLGQGYCDTDDVFNFSSGSQKTYRDIFPIKALNAKKMSFLRQACDLCQSKNVQLVVLFAPIARHNVLDYGDTWFQQTDEIRQLVESHGATFYDFDLVKTELFPFDEKYYYDTQHLNIHGAEHFTKVLAAVLDAQRKGEDCSRFFYTPEEYRNSFDKVAFVQVETTPADSGISFTARAVVGEGKTAEYQYLVRGEGEEHWRLLRDYSTEPTCTLSGEEGSTYQIVVNARLVGSQEKFEKHRQLKVKL